MAAQSPRKINPGETFDRIVHWIRNRAVKDRMPGMIVGVSGTDSLVVFLAAYQAFKQLGRPEAVTAVNFIHPGTLERTPDGKIACAGAPDKDWFAREIMPWLEKTAPGATYVLDDSIPFSDDNKRWGNIFSRAISDSTVNHDLFGNYRLVAGTRNKTEAELGTYTLLSRAPSLQPIEHLYKTEILDICAYLGVPQIAIDKSREIDCDCGRFDVQANHMDELDRCIMTRRGELDPACLDTMDPDVFAAVRSFYLEERVNNNFREKIPYRPTPTKTVYQGEDLAAAMGAVLNGDGDSQTRDISAVSRAAPRILIDRDADSAHKIVTAPSPNRPEWRAEAFVLMGTEGLSPAQKADMAQAVFGPGAAFLPREDADTLAVLTGRIGQYGFSFPAKRFTTQRFAGGPSLIERAGFTRQARPSDLRDPSLPAADPRRDALGTGFTWTDGNWHVEQRRAYLLFSHLTQEAPVTLIVRNSSPFFGRDRLREAAYVSFAPQTTEGLLTLDADSIGDPARFTPWQDVLRAETGPSLREKFRRASFALDALQGVDLKFSQWLRTRAGEVRFKTPHESLRAMFNDKSGHGQEGGYTHLRAFLKTALMAHIDAEKAGSPLYLAQLDPGETAPWQPHDICPVTADTLAQLKDAENGTPVPDEKLGALFTPLKPRPLILMSGRYGDFPSAPVARPAP